MANKWIDHATFYHIYPLGFCGAPPKNDNNSPPVERLFKVLSWIDHFKKLGINALYLGPVFESVEHGYDPTNYFEVDRRLGTNSTLKNVISELHKNDIRVILDGVFNHVGRDFFAFRDLQQHRTNSMFTEWFTGLDFSKYSPMGDPFTYATWDGHYNLVKLNLNYPYVESHLFNAVKMWIDEFNIDGLRLDAADNLSPGFIRRLSSFTRNLKPDFWLMGEVVHGDYKEWANPESLDSTTNYECYKSLYSSFNDKNMFEIAYALNRQNGDHGLYQHLKLYNFLDNHDVDRIATSLKDIRHLYPLHILLFTMPGIPSIYYGSEWGITGKKGGHNDLQLRPSLELDSMYREFDDTLIRTIQKLSNIRKYNDALKNGNYKEIKVEPEFLAFSRQTPDQKVVVLINGSDREKHFKIQANSATDLLNENQFYRAENGSIRLKIYPNWGMILKVE
ncbi:MAG: alpha-amylase family glycosyl hydrolase [Candidatus Neomarinimicrobiota bacterium]